MKASLGGSGRSTTPEGTRGHALGLAHGTSGVKLIGTLNPLLSHRGNTRAMRVERPVESGSCTSTRTVISTSYMYMY